MRNDRAAHADSGAAARAAFTARAAEMAKANTLLATFHAVCRRDVAAGLMPTIAESLAAMVR